MSRNFDGLGIGIQVDDNGSEQKMKKFSGTVDGLWDGLKETAKLGPKIGRGLSKVGGMVSNALGGVSMAMGTAVDKAMSPELDNAYSSMYADFNKSFGVLTAGMNTSENVLKKARKAIGGAAFGMGEDMDQAAQNWVHFEKQGLELDKIIGTQGLTGTIRGLIKVTSVYEMQGEQLAQVMGGLVKGFDFTESAVGELADKMVASGRVFNMGKEALQAWPTIFESLNNELADFGKTLSPKEIENLTLSIVQLGGGLKEALGLAPQQAMELSRTMFSTIAGERKNIINMFRGMGGEFGDVAKGLMEAGGDVNKMFEVMTDGDPLKFMDTLRAMSEEAKKRGGETGMAFQRLSGVMTQALGPDVAFAMKGNWDKAQESLAKVPEALKGSKGVFKEVAEEHWKTSITAGESWDRMIEGMKARLFRLSDKEVGGWQKNMKKGFEKTFKVIEKFAKKDGPVGELTQRFLAVQRVGLSALIPGLGALSPLLGGVATSAMPVLTAFGAMGGSFKSLGLMGLAGGAVYGLFKVLKEGPEEALKKLKSFGKDVWEVLGDLFPNVTKKAEGFFGFFKSGDLGKSIKKMISKIDLSKVTGWITKKFKAIPWREMVSGLSKVIFSTVKAIVGTVFSVIKNTNWVSVFKDITIFLIDSTIEAVKGIKDAIVDEVVSLLESNPEIKKALEGLFGKDFVKTIEEAGNDIDGTKIYHNVVAGAESGINSIVSSFGWMSETVKGSFVALKTSFIGTWSFIDAMIEKTILNVQTRWKTGVIVMAATLEKFRFSIQEEFYALKDSLIYPFDWLSHKLDGWMATIIEKLFGTKQKPTALSRFMGTVLGDQADTMMAGVRAIGAQSRSRWKQEGGDKFEEWWNTERGKERGKRKEESFGTQESIARKMGMTLGQDKAQRAALANQVKQAVNDMGASSRWSQDTVMRGAEALKQQIDYQKDAFADADKRIAKERAETAAAEGEDAGKRGKGKGRRGRKKKSQETEASVPTAEQRAASSDRMVVDDMMKVIQGQQVEMIKRTDALTKAVSKMGANPIEAYLTVEMDGKKVSKGLVKHELNSAGGRGNR